MSKQEQKTDLFAGLAPFQRHSETSRQAAIKIHGKARTGALARVYRHIESRGSRGATDPETQAALKLSGDTQRPRRVELKEAGMVVDSNKVRNGCVVWVAASVASAMWEGHE